MIPWTAWGWVMNGVEVVLLVVYLVGMVAHFVVFRLRCTPWRTVWPVYLVWPLVYIAAPFAAAAALIRRRRPVKKYSTISVTAVINLPDDPGSYPSWFRRHALGDNYAIDRWEDDGGRPKTAA